MSQSAPYRLRLDDGGRNLSRRPAQTSDCTVRALAIITGHDYDDIYDLLKDGGRKSHQGFDLDGWLRVSPCKVKGMPLAKLNKRGLTVHNFAIKHPKGKFLIETKNHVWAGIDGIHHDLIRVKDESLASIWRVTL